MLLPKLPIFRSNLNQRSFIPNQSFPRNLAKEKQNNRYSRWNLNNMLHYNKNRDKMSKISAFYLLILSVLVMSHSSLAANESGQVNNSKKICSADNLTPKPKPTTTPQRASDKSQVQSQAIESSTISMPDTNEQQASADSFLRPRRRQTRSIAEQTTTDYQPTSIETKVSAATTQFGLNFLNSSQDSKENVVISPLSLQTLLNMILLGSDDNSSTQKELCKVLGYETTGLLPAELSADRLKPHEALKNVLDSILQNTNHVGENPSPDNVNFNLANLVLTNKALIELKPDYEKELKKYYSANIDHFSSPAKDAANKLEPLEDRVNKWVRNNTQNQIQKLVNEGDLSGSELLMVLLNAANFKGRWLHTFDTKSTSDRAFFNNGDTDNGNQVKFMRQKESFGYADFTTKQFELASNSIGVYSIDSDTQLTQDKHGEQQDKPTTIKSEVSKSESVSAAANSTQYPLIELSKEDLRRLELSKKLNCTVLMMPFSLNEGQELSMVILLPAKNDGIEALHKALDAQILNEIYRSLDHLEIRVEIPKFSFEVSHDAKSTLSKMGLKDIFESPKFDKMLTFKGGANSSSKVDKIIHKAKITVDETGAEAAAASMASIVLRNFIRQPAPLFIADHPFLFIIRHSRSNMPLFMGRVSHL